MLIPNNWILTLLWLWSVEFMQIEWLLYTISILGNISLYWSLLTVVKGSCALFSLHYWDYKILDHDTLASVLDWIIALNRLFSGNSRALCGASAGSNRWRFWRRSGRRRQRWARDSPPSPGNLRLILCINDRLPNWCLKYFIVSTNRQQVLHF